MAGKHVGQSMTRREDPRFLQGQGKYVANIQMPGMAHMAVLRSPYGHARIRNIDTSRAAALPGVLGVFVGQDLIDGGVGKLPCGWNVPNIKVPDRWPLTIDKVRHVGDGVAVVVAETPYIAYDALELIDVDYEELPAIVDGRATTEAGAPVVHDSNPDNVCFVWPLGDREATEAALASAATVVEIDLYNNRLIPNAMETRAAVARWDAAMEEMTLWTTSQNPSPIRLLLSAFTLGIPENKLRVISPDVGGGFGSKIFHYPEEIMAPWLARKLNRPVKWVATRSESYITDSQGRDHITHAKMALDADNRITGLWVETWANLGAYVSTFGPLIPTALYVCLLSGLYKIPAIYADVRGTLTNTVPVDAYRGAGRPEASYVVERLVDMAARKVGMDPIAFRRLNFVQPDEFPFQTAVVVTYDSGNYDGLFDILESESGYQELVAERDSMRAEGRVVGLGISGCIEACGLAPSRIAGALGGAIGFFESAVIRVHPTGKVTVLTGSHSHGQGHETTFAQVVADELGVSMDDIEIVHGDTGRVPYGLGTYGSRSISVGGSALVKAAAKVREKVRRIAAHQLEAAESDLEYNQDDGVVYVRGAPDRNMSFATLAFAANVAHNIPDNMEPGLEESAFFDPVNFTFPNSAHIALVELSRDTGEVTIHKYVAVDDVGTVINPLIVDGQIAGGIVQGIGQALYENAVYDSNGQLLSGSMMDYTVPRARMFPNFQTARQETPSPANPLGVKGAGEMGTIIGTVTVANAVMDALAPFGVEHMDMPLTAPKLWHAMNP